MKKYTGTVRLRFNYSRALGPRSEAAGVGLSLSVRDAYEFVNAARWPAEDYGAAVERGVRDGLAEAGVDPEAGVRVVLEDVEFHPVYSCERAFYRAAKCAVKAHAEV
jgi:translation elongation factor EF-G